MNIKTGKKVEIRSNQQIVKELIEKPKKIQPKSQN